ncbi:MAG: CAP domain-containing protein, partial [Actinobacteria bacterium]|nr:CAP domain-containing protein [Actinomycetota bacterium]
LERFGYTFDGYSYYAYGENIAWGCGSNRTPERRLKSWMHSPDHKAKILDKRFREVGIGVLTGTYKSCTRAAMYTVDFGVRRR